MDEITRQRLHWLDVNSLLLTVQQHFGEINQDENLTDEDKARLKATA